VKVASSSSPCVVTTTPISNIELPQPSSKIAKNKPKNRPVTCTEIPDVDASPQFNLPTPNNELLLPVEDLHPLDPSFPKNKPELPVPRKSSSSVSIDDMIDLFTLGTCPYDTLFDSLRNWAHTSRSLELSKTLIDTLLNVSRPLVSQILIQLQEPQACLRTIEVGKYRDKSLVVPTVLQSLDKQISIADGNTLIDCGASGRGYISSKFVDLHHLPCVPLPYHIPIFNVDGSQNVAGAIKRLCTLDMRIGGHNERITFRVTETGSTNVILGLDWLRLHDPLINWSKGKISFLNCPSHNYSESRPQDLCTGFSSSLPPSSPSIPEDLGPDGNFSRSIFDCNSPEDIISEWEDTLQKELGPDDDALLCIDINSNQNDSGVHPKDTRIPDYLRQTKSQCQNIDRYLKEFAPVFSQSGFDELPPRRSWDHAIELKPSEESKPISSKVYSLSRQEQLELDKFLEEHLKTGRIRPSKSPIASPFFFVKKKDGSLRPVQDYRRLNEITIRNRYPLPLVSELMDKLKGAKYFTKLDVRWGYENIRIKEGDEWKAAFITNRGLFEPTVMFFGLTNSPATFQNMMNDIFKDLLLAGHVIIYMDNILIFTDDLITHRLITRQVLSVLQKHNLFLKPEKCSFESLEVEYLGVVISQGKLKMDPKKIEALEN
jgi:hypothetical protein